MGKEAGHMGEAARKLVTFAEYIAFEEKAETKHEYRNGEIVELGGETRESAMAGGTLEHARLQLRVAHALCAQLEGRPCEAFSSDARVRVLATGLATYPDLSVVCGNVERDPEHGETLTNPVLLVEVLSPSTEAYDRGDKFHEYKKIPSLREYVLVSSEERRIEVFRRQGDGSWRYYDTAERGVAESRIHWLQARPGRYLPEAAQRKRLTLTPPRPAPPRRGAYGARPRPISPRPPAPGKAGSPRFPRGTRAAP